MKTTSFFLTTAILLLFCLNTNAQNRIFEKGQFDVNLGIGVVPTYLMDGGKTITPPLSLGLDYLLNEKISVGLIYGHSVSEGVPELISDGVLTARNNHTSVFGLRGAMHVTKFDNWDIYGGFQLAYNHIKIDSKAPAQFDQNKGIEPEKSTVSYTGFVGAKYAFAKRFHAFSEVGFDISIFKMGIGIQL